MTLPEWGYSYNALYVPLTSDWHCALVPARDVKEVDRGWKLSYDERQKARKEREEQIEQDRKDFDRLFRVSLSRRDARACSEFSTYTAYIRDYLRITGIFAPLDGEDVTRILRDAVRNGRLIPVIDRAWRGSRRVTQRHAPQSWPKRAPDPKPIIYGVRNGEFVPLDANGYFIDRTPYVPVATRAAAGASNGASSMDDDYWPAAIEETAETVIGTYDSNSDDRNSETSEPGTLMPTPLADAQVLEYKPDMLDGDAIDIAKTPNEGDPGTWYTNPGSGQMRLYGDDGNAVVDFDFDHDHGQGVPHAHNWETGTRGPGVPFSLLP